MRSAHLVLDPRPWIFEDAFARSLVGPLHRLLLGAPFLLRVAERFEPALAAARAQAVIRSRFVEDRLERALARGVTQYVLLAAGLDTFSLRRPDLMGRLSVFEVDHHATQAWKRERLFRLEERLPANLTLVPVDFETDLLARSLAAAGFRSDRPALFSWIGTTYYLTADAITRTIDALSQLAAPGSELLLDYLLPESGMGADDRRILRRVRRFAERSGEPLLASFRPDEMEHALEAHGWHVLEDLSPQQQRETYLAGRNDTLLLPNLNHLLRARAGPDHG